MNTSKCKSESESGSEVECECVSVSANVTLTVRVNVFFGRFGRKVKYHTPAVSAEDASDTTPLPKDQMSLNKQATVVMLVII